MSEIHKHREREHPLFMRLERVLRLWRRGLVRAWLLRAAGATAAVLAMYGVADYFLALPEMARAGIGGGLLLVLAVYAAVALRRIWRLTLRDAAMRVDRVRKDPRRSVQTALELRCGERVNAEPSPFLVQKCVADVGLRFQQIPVGRFAPARTLRRAWQVGLGLVILAGVVALLKPAATGVIVPRLFAPLSDVPPYSPLEFRISPQPAQAIYGDAIELNAQITGGEVDQPVYLLSRAGGEVQRVDCFRGSENRFSQRLENVVAPVEFCFATGKARSRWQRVEVLIEPRFSVAKLNIESPAYSGLAPRELMVGNEELKALRGSKAMLTVTSNRPLSRGTAVFVPAGENEAARQIEGKQTGVHTVTFSWELLRDGEFAVEIYDVQGTASPEPLKLTQKALPDEKPVVVLHSPAAFVLATPTTILPVSASASDDIALRRVDFVRSMPGFRDRMLTAGPPSPQRNLTLNRELDLGRVGVEPGEVLELYVEARDENPAMTGFQTSEVARVEIIAEEEYAGMLRESMGLEEFSARYRLVREQWEALKQAIQKAREAAASGESEAEALDEARKAAAETAKLFEQFGKDFPAFESERALNEMLRGLAGTVGEVADALGGMKPGMPGVEQELEDLLAKLGGGSGEMEQQMASAEEIEKVGRLMEQAARFGRLVEAQRQITRQLARLRADPAADSMLLRFAEERESELRKEAEDLAEAIREAGAQVPEKEEYAKLKSDAAEFATALEESGAAHFMGRAATAAENGDAAGGYRFAQLALERLEALISPSDSPGNQFAGMCRGGLDFQMRQDVAATMQQMLAALMSRGRGGRGGVGASGVGFGGTGGEGGPMSGFSQRALPVFGPERSRLASPGGSAEGRGRPGGGRAVVVSADARDEAGKPEMVRPPGEVMPLERAPEKYRDAVRRFFRLSEEKP